MKTWMKKLTALILIALLVVGSINLTVDLNGESGEGLSFSITEASAKGKNVAPKKVTVQGSKYVAKGKKIKLKAVVAPEGANQKVTWSSSNPSVATVDQKGNVKGIKAGKVKITAASKDNPKKKKAYAVQVMEQAVKKVIISGAPETMMIGATVALKAAPDPKKAAKSFEWKSSNTAIATVSAKGQVSAVSAGQVTITATATDGSKKKSSVTITVVAPEEPTPTPEPAPTPEPTPDPATLDQDFTKDGASYHYNGAAGTVTLTSAASSNGTGYVTIPADVDVPNVGKRTVAKVAMSALSGQKLNYIRVEGKETKVEDATGAAYVIATSESQIVTAGGAKFVSESVTEVEGNFLYEVESGSATLLCPVDERQVPDNVVVPATVAGEPVTKVEETALGNVTTVKSLSVPEGVEVSESLKEITTERIPVDSITITAEDEIPQEIVAGKTFTLKAEVKAKDDKDPTNAEVEWISDHPEFATVTEENGIATVKGISYGTATITAVAKDGSKVEATNPVEVQVWNDPTTGIVNIGTGDYDNEMNLAQTQTLTPILNPALDTFKGLSWSWSSSNSTAISVENGLITANEGTSEPVTITATLTLNGEALTGNNSTATFTVNKVNAPVESITLTAEGEIPQEIITGETFTLKAEVKAKDGKNPTNAEVEWVSDHPEFAKVTEENGIATVTGVSYGTATITAVAKDGSEVEATNPVVVQVWNNPTTGIVSIGTGDYESEMDLAQTQTLTPILNPALNTFKGLTWTWSSSNSTAISTENGLITANGATSEPVNITATLTLNGVALTGNNSTATFTVNKVYAPVGSITLSPDTATLVSDHEYEIADITQVTVLPAEARQEWTWSAASSSTSVTTKDNKKIIIDSTVTTKQEVQIGVQAGSKTAILKVTVLPNPLSVSISADKDVNVLNLYAPAGKDTVQLTAQVEPKDADQSVVWKSMNESIASVDDDGFVTAHAEGKVKIRATSKNKEELPYSEYEIEVVNEELTVNDKGVLTAFVIPSGGVTVIPAETADGTAITAIDPELFKNNTALTKLTISANVALIPEGLCEGCTSLTEVVLPDSITAIESNAFKGTALTELTIPGKVKAIPASLCEGCASLKKVIMPNGITVIGQAAFKGCTSLSSSETYDGAAE